MGVASAFGESAYLIWFTRSSFCFPKSSSRMVGKPTEICFLMVGRILAGELRSELAWALPPRLYIDSSASSTVANCPSYFLMLSTNSSLCTEDPDELTTRSICYCIVLIYFFFWSPYITLCVQSFRLNNITKNYNSGKNKKQWNMILFVYFCRNIWIY